MSYEMIKKWARERGCSVEDLLAMARKNDPFYMGQPWQVRAAEWFAEQYEQQKPVSHLRRLHYRLFSQDPPVQLPTTLRWKTKDGEERETDIYLNIERCWDYLAEASKAARWLDLVPVDVLEDRKNPAPMVHAHWQPRAEPEYNLEPGESWHWHTLPTVPRLADLPGRLPDAPGFEVDGFDVQQEYHVEVWIEKSGENDILIPLCQEYGVNLITGEGELSITAVAELMPRVRQAERPARILYISDFDPAGLDMPCSVARKIEYFQRTRGYDDIDVKLDQIALTLDQVQEYDLPRKPGKDTDMRLPGFEDSHGTGVVELDALEALHPGAMRRIVEQAILNYYDPDLHIRAMEQKWALRNHLDNERRRILEDHDGLTALNEEYRALYIDFEKTRERFAELAAPFQEEIDAYQERMASIEERGREIHVELYYQLEEIETDPDALMLPEPDLPTEPTGQLYESDRDYFEQLEWYKEHRGRG